MSRDQEQSSKSLELKMSEIERARAEQISELVDGELPPSQQLPARESFVSAVVRDEASALRWARYQGIGDMLRSPELVPTARDEAFMTRMRLSLAAEPVVLAPQSEVQVGQRMAAGKPRQPMNDGVGKAAARTFPLKTVGMAGGLAAAAVIAMNWSMLVPTRSSAPAASGGIELSQKVAAPVTASVATVAEPLRDPALVVVQTANGSMVRNARLDQYFAAHSGMRSGLGSGASMAASAGFVRGASIDNAAQQ